MRSRVAALLPVAILAAGALYGFSRPVPSEARTTLPTRLILPRIPGAYNLAVTQGNLKRTVCKSGYSASIRPSSSYTTALKKRQIAALGYANRNYHAYEEDHLVPLELGGHPTSPLNLWPEPWTQAHKSDPYENYIHYRLCRHDVSLRYARELIINLKRVKG